jgi:small subunit ribosomal protein S1
VGHPDELLSVNDRIKAKILEIDPEKGKISLSARQAATDPWDTVHEKFKAGDKATGKVTRCADFGAFVEIAPGIEGLVHVSEMSYLKRVARAEDVVSPGDTVPVTIKDVDPVHRRISLSMKDAEGDPWMGIEKKYAKGQVCSGTIEKKEAFGYFVTLEPGVVGLLPKSKINSAPNVGEIERMKINDPITVKVEEIDPGSRKISLGVEGGGDDWKEFAPAGEGPASGAMGSLGEKLRSALVSKK